MASAAAAHAAAAPAAAQAEKAAGAAAAAAVWRPHVGELAKDLQKLRECFLKPWVYDTLQSNNRWRDVNFGS
jgi:hypothetical protein